MVSLKLNLKLNWKKIYEHFYALNSLEISIILENIYSISYQLYSFKLFKLLESSDIILKDNV